MEVIKPFIPWILAIIALLIVDVVKVSQSSLKDDLIFALRTLTDAQRVGIELRDVEISRLKQELELYHSAPGDSPRESLRGK